MACHSLWETATLDNKDLVKRLHPFGMTSANSKRFPKSMQCEGVLSIESDIPIRHYVPDFSLRAPESICVLGVAELRREIVFEVPHLQNFFQTFFISFVHWNRHDSLKNRFMHTRSSRQIGSGVAVWLFVMQIQTCHIHCDTGWNIV